MLCPSRIELSKKFRLNGSTPMFAGKGGIASPRSVFTEAQDAPDPNVQLGSRRRPVRGARGRAPSLDCEELPRSLQPLSPITHEIPHNPNSANCGSICKSCLLHYTSLSPR